MRSARASVIYFGVFDWLEGNVQADGARLRQDFDWE
jgi:hypothetical protein